MRSPSHLWSGPWREQSEQVEAQLADNAPAPRDDPDPEPVTQLATPPRRRPGARTAAMVAVPVALGLGGAYLAGTWSGGDDQAATASGRTLPAASAAPLTPRTGQTRAGAIYAKASPAVVSIRAGSASGTGFLVDDTSTVVTNAHVVESTSQVTVRFGPDGRDISARVAGTDPSSDLAVIQLPSGSAPADAKPLALADSSQVQVGDEVIAIGNPFGLDRTATEGIVSGLGRSIQAPNGFSIDDAIQTDAPINPGNSGGPLLDSSGRVVGVNSQIETGGASQGNLGIGFAVPADTVRSVVPRLERGQQIERAWLGVSTGETTSSTGAQVGDVTAGGPADDAGIQRGDVILAIDGRAVSDPSDVSQVVADSKPGRRVELRIERGGSERTVDVELGTRPAQVP